MYLSVIIPAYNEEKRLGKTLIETNSYLANKHFDYEIIVVSDGSTDRTVEIVRGLKSTISNLEIIANEKNRGKGFVVRQGLLAAHGQYRLFTDADNATPINQLESLLPHLNRNDIVIGSRVMHGSTIIKSQPLYRRALGNAYRYLVNIIISNMSFQDTQCGFKIFNANSVEKIMPKCQINGFSFDVETLIIARKFGYNVKEVPIIWQNDPNTRLGPSGMIRAIFELFYIKILLVLGKYNRVP